MVTAILHRSNPVALQIAKLEGFEFLRSAAALTGRRRDARDRDREVAGQRARIAARVHRSEQAAPVFASTTRPPACLAFSRLAAVGEDGTPR